MRDFWSYPHHHVVDASGEDIAALEALADKFAPSGYDWQFCSSTEAEFRFDVMEEAIIFAIMTYGGLKFGFDDL